MVMLPGCIAGCSRAAAECVRGRQEGTRLLGRTVAAIGAPSPHGGWEESASARSDPDAGSRRLPIPCRGDGRRTAETVLQGERGNTSPNRITDRDKFLLVRATMTRWLRRATSVPQGGGAAPRVRRGVSVCRHGEPPKLACKNWVPACWFLGSEWLPRSRCYLRCASVTTARTGRRRGRRRAVQSPVPAHLRYLAHTFGVEQGVTMARQHCQREREEIEDFALRPPFSACCMIATHSG